MTTSQDLPDTPERRHQKRLWAPVPIKLIGPDKAQLISAVNQNISWGGALFTLAQPLAEGVDSLIIYLPWTRGKHISIRATVLRTTPLPNGQHRVAVRFSSLTPKNQLRLEKLLNVLRASDNQADHKDATELFQELVVMVDDTDEFRHILAQIADGRCTLQEFRSYEKNQSIALSVEGPDNLPAIHLRARVIDTKKADGVVCDWSNLHLVTLALEHPRNSVTPLIRSLLDRLPKAPGEAPAVGSSAVGRTYQAVVADNPCAIEAELPAVLVYLTAIWNDPATLGSFFRDLVDIDHADPGWPAEVWDELFLLKGVHERIHDAVAVSCDLGTAFPAPGTIPSAP